MNALLVAAKRPAPGRTKSRLTPPLTPAEAAQLYESFLLDTLDLARGVRGVRHLLAYLPRAARGYFRRLAPDFDLLPQHGADLGSRLDHALSRCLAGGFESAVIVGSDSPTLPAEYLARAFTALEEADVVIGPCDDGGYYLIGLRRPAPRLLRGVRMSTPTVFQDTLAIAAEDHLSVAQLPRWFDVDSPADLDRLRADLERLPPGRAAHTRRFLTVHLTTK